MDTFDRIHLEKTSSLRSMIGLILVLSGAVLFLDRYLQTGWLSLLILPAVGIYFFQYGIRFRNSRFILVGGMLTGAGAGAAVSLNGFVIHQSIIFQVGLMSIVTATCWGVTAIVMPRYSKNTAWWILIPVGILAGIGSAILFGSAQWIEFIFAIGLGLGLALLFWGGITRLFGLIIAGSLVATIASGFYFAWRDSSNTNTLMQTGVMLTWFASGWFLMTLSTRVLYLKYVWWPLIPGGILAVVGLGLYIGGDPGNALGFISNTGGILLMVFGLYLLLMRKGIHHD